MFPEHSGINQTTIGHSDACEGNKFHTTINIEKRDCNMELDTGSFFIIISWETLKRLNPTFPRRKLQP